MKTSRFALVSLSLLMMFLFSTTALASDTSDMQFVNAKTVKRNLPERPADAKVIEIAEILIDEDGNMTVTEEPSISTMSYFSPAAITLSSSGKWYKGQWRTFSDGTYLGYDVTATYSDGSTSDYNGLFIYLESATTWGDNNRTNWAIPLDGNNHKGDDWRKIQGDSRDYRFAYYNNTYDIPHSGEIKVKVTAYSWD